MKKKFLALILALSTLFSTSIPVFAAEKVDVAKFDSDYHIMWSNTDVVISQLNFTGSKSECGGEVYGKSGTTKIVATILLKQVKPNGAGTKTVKSWTQTVNSDILYFYKEYYVSKGYDYELEVSAKVYRNGTVESVSVSDYDYCG